MSYELLMGYITEDFFGYGTHRKMRVTLEIDLNLKKRHNQYYYDSYDNNIEKKYKYDPTLSISGNVWNHNSTDIIMGGQIYKDLEKFLVTNSIEELQCDKYDLLRLIDIWKEWHLNDLTPYCIHQEKLMDKIKKEKGNDFFNASNYSDIIKIPEFGKCPKCGYTYGTEWLFKRLPNDVMIFLSNTFLRGIVDHIEIAKVLKY